VDGAPDPAAPAAAPDRGLYKRGVRETRQVAKEASAKLAVEDGATAVEKRRAEVTFDERLNEVREYVPQPFDTPKAPAHTRAENRAIDSLLQGSWRAMMTCDDDVR
jgi:phosphohistidine phosphatase SixA